MRSCTSISALLNKTAGLSYVEVTLGDIELANRIAHEVLGRSLDEMPPQTRRFLNLLHGMVTKTCGEKKCEPRLCPFSQRQARGYTGWSAFQVKKHLSRLAEWSTCCRIAAGTDRASFTSWFTTAKAGTVPNSSRA